MLNRSVKTWECGKLAITVEDLRIYEKEKVAKRKKRGGSVMGGKKVILLSASVGVGEAIG